VPPGATSATPTQPTVSRGVHGTGQPSDWLLRWQHLLEPGHSAIDVACGAGRHVRWLSGHGLKVTAVDRDAAALSSLTLLNNVTTLCADLEGSAWPLPGRQFDLVLVTHYLWRPLLGTLIDAVAPGGLLIYETFASGQETVGRPSRPDFLLRPGELLSLTQARFHVLGYEDGWSADEPMRRVQRVCARRPSPSDAPQTTDATLDAQSAHLPQNLRLPAFKPV
jgi:hypothetical protein